jgi:hypothetical protein
MKNNFNISVHCVTLPNHSMLVGACARRYILVIVRRLKSGFLHERVTHQNHPLAIQFLVGTRLLILVI